MTPQSQIIATAETVGWFECGTGGSWSWRHSSFTDESQDVRTENLPNYLEDLNACFEMELFLTREGDQDEYVNQLWQVIGAGYWSPNYSEDDFHWIIVHSTAPQRAEAFLKTVGKWEETV